MGQNKKQGVPQGSILGHLFFLIHINNIPNTTADPSKSVLFAGDTGLIITNNIFKFKENVNYSIGNLNDWFRGNSFFLNFDKHTFHNFSLK